MIYIAIRSVILTFSDFRASTEAEVFVLAVDGVLGGRLLGFGLGLAGSNEDVYYEENSHAEDHEGAVVTRNLIFVLLVIKNDLWSFRWLCWLFLKWFRCF